MPELPEVEVIRLGLNRFLPGRTITTLEVRRPKLFVGDPAEFIGQKITGVRRRAKILLIDLTGGTTVLIHLKLTGQLVYVTKEEARLEGGHPETSYNQPLPHRHTHIIIAFDDGSRLYFNDLRRFGWMRLVATRAVETTEPIAGLGPEILDGLTAAKFRVALARYPNRTVFSSLLDQKLLAGIGNIYANEALYEAGILPTRPVKDVTEWPSLYRAVRRVLRKSLRHGGTTDSTFVSARGERGNYLTYAHVYHQKTARPCGHAVTRSKIGGRTTHVCRQCQK